MKWLLATITILMLMGCGVDWFPSNTAATSGLAPEAFSFTPLTAQPLSTVVQSAPVVITGTNTAGWTVSVSDATTGAKSTYSINNGTPTSTPGTILPNQSLTIGQTTAQTLGTIATTVVNVGTFQTTFQTTTTVSTTQ
jgi:hypothetical protein